MPKRGSGGDAMDARERRELLGRQPADDQVPFLDADQVDRAEEPTPTAIYEGELEAEGGLIEDDPDRRSFESLTDRELRAGETDDPNEAAEEGLTYVPPSDPPVIAGEAGEPEVAAGFASSAIDDEPFDADHHSEAVTTDDEVSERVRDALRADAATSDYADAVDVETDGRVVILRGSVADLDDEDALVAVAERVAGISQVIDELEVRALG
jgi:BON domain